MLLSALGRNSAALKHRSRGIYIAMEKLWVNYLHTEIKRIYVQIGFYDFRSQLLTAVVAYRPSAYDLSTMISFDSLIHSFV